MFDFASTNRKLCIFIPNFGRGNYIRKTLSQFSTDAASDDYVIVIGNDGIVEDFSDLIGHNVNFFTIDRGSNPVVRNGGFIRNYFIKRCQSEILFQKDPETILYNIYETSDWIQNVIRLTSEWSIYRPGYTQELDKNLSDDFYHSKDLKLINANITGSNPTQYSRIHWAYAVATKNLIALRGYDEDFTQYGPEDMDMYMRLKNRGLSVEIDDSTRVSHLYHDISPEIYESVKRMQDVAISKKSHDFVRNTEKWGELREFHTIT